MKLRIHTTKEQVYDLIRKMGTYRYVWVGRKYVQHVEPRWLEVMLKHSHEEDEGEMQVRLAQSFASRLA